VSRPCAVLAQSSAKDTLAERLRRRPAKAMGSPRVGSNPTGVAASMRQKKDTFVRGVHAVRTAASTRQFNGHSLT
jgi:hypothetical protein